MKKKQRQYTITSIDKKRLPLLWGFTDFELKVYKVPEHIDKEIARLKLKALGVKIDGLTKKQKEYLSSWEIGT